MTKAVIKTGGKQYLVSEGDEITIEKLSGEEGEEHTFEDVLLRFDDEDIDLGQPDVEDAEVTAEILEQGKADKVTAFKIKRKKGYRRKKGHKQPLTKVRIKEIS